MKLTINYPGGSLLDIKKKFPKLFWEQDWYETQDFAKEHIEAGQWEIDFDLDKTFNKTWTEQTKGNKKAAPAAVLTYAVFSHFEKTGERLLETSYSRTSSGDSDGPHVLVGYFDAKGLDVGYGWDDRRRSDVGLAAGRKLSAETREVETVESLNLEKWKEQVQKDV